jgi:hypothetical protein
MAIKDTIQWLEGKIPTSKTSAWGNTGRSEFFREKYGNSYKHTVVYPKNWCIGFVTEELAKILYKNISKEMGKKAGMRGSASSSNRLAKFKNIKNIIRVEANKAYAHAYNPTAIRQAWNKGYATKFRGLITHNKAVGYSVTYVANTGKFKWAAKHDEKKTKGATSEISRVLIEEMARETWRKVKKNSAYKQLNVQAGNVANPLVDSLILGKGDTGNRLHGVPTNTLNPSAKVANNATSQGQDAGVIALLGFEEDVYDGIDDFIQTGKTYCSHYMDIIEDALDVEYKVNNLKFSDIKQFRDEITIFILMGRQNQNSLMRYADANGIREFLANLQELLLKNLGADDGTDKWDAKKGSKTTPRERMENILTAATVEPILKNLKKNANLKVTTKGIKKGNKTRSTTKGKMTASKASKGKRKGRTTKPPRITKAVLAVGAGTAKGKARSKLSKGVGGKNSPWDMNPIGLQQLLNKALPARVQENMGPYPRKLENRTGRFAGSAQVTQVVPMPKSVEIRYDYMQDPYSVFEPGSGNPLASAGRDPKALIGGTIRELAQSIMGNKYGLIRTKRV